MKPNKLASSRSRKILGFLCVGGLLIIAFAGAFRQYSASQLQHEPLSLPVPVLQQSRGTSCGEAVITMVYNYAYPNTPITEQEVIEYAAANGYFTEGVPPFTSPANMVKIAQYYAEDVSSGNVLSAGQGLSLLKQKLRNGEPVIIDVLTDFSDPQSEAHFVVVTGISVNPERNNAVVIHYNDPLTGTQRADDWAGSQGVWNAWRTNGDPGGAGWWLVISPP
ncbi:MAG TPA: papain-like cysteine protease family protein [Anaerolineales bacterium]